MATGWLGRLFGGQRHRTAAEHFADYASWTPVTSSNVSSIAFYESPTQVSANELGVRFKNGTTYYYYGLTRALFIQFLNAPSKGVFLDRRIKKTGVPYRGPV